MRYRKLSTIKSLVNTINNSVVYEQGSIINGDAIVNFHAYTLTKSRIVFELYSSINKQPLSQIVKRTHTLKKTDFMIGINTNAFFMAEEGTRPTSWSFNLDIKHGVPLQLPTNKRPTLITRNGKIKLDYLRGNGSLKIGNNTIDWRGSHSDIGVNTIVYGNFDIPQKRKIRSGRTIITSDYNDAWIAPKENELLVGLSLKNEEVAVSQISSERLNLFDFLFIMSCPKNITSKINITDLVHSAKVGGFEFTKDHSAQSLIAELPKNKNNILGVFKNYLINNKLTSEFIEKYKKAWSLVIEKQNEIILLVIDARPQVKGQEGLNAYELHDFISNNFNFEKAFITDAGQSSRIVYSGENEFLVHGNMHYLDYKQKPPVWSGEKGRFVPGALLAYNRI